MTPEQTVDKVYAATGVLLGTDKAPHIASYMAVMEARIAELEAALNGIINYVEDSDRDYCEWYHDTKEMARAALEGKGNE